jgi:formylglycine-generating enzyme required for sulfatase activity
MKRILGIAIVLGLVGALTFIAGCSKGKLPQAKEETAAVVTDTAAKKKINTEEPVGLGNGVKLEMVLISAGNFMMGSPASEVGRKDNETQHEVTLTKPFYMGKYEVTQEQWEAVMGSNPSKRTKGAKFPVTHVSWEDCQEFIRKLNSKTNGGFRLPTEAEWEYACRAGTTTAYSFGDKITPKDANYHDSKLQKPESEQVTSVVGSYKPNAFGLYDMHGNVWEWCEDRFGDYPRGSVTNPKGPSTGVYTGDFVHRVLRGGSFNHNVSLSRSSYRSDEPTVIYKLQVGVRLARTP